MNVAIQDPSSRGPRGRRWLLKKGLLGGALLFVAGAIPVALRSTLRRHRPKQPLRLFNEDEHAIVAAVAARIVPGDGAGAAWPSAEAVDCAGKIDDLMSRVHPAMGAELRRLLVLFENGLTGLVAIRRPRPFTRCSPEEQDRRLESWRRSRVALFRTGHQALVRLVHATYFSSPEVFPLVGYPGPPVVPA